VHIEEAGFKVERHDFRDTAVKEEFGIPANLTACHSAVVSGYLIEGHVPAADIRRLLREKPDIVGLIAPGMPLGSPGVERPGYVGTFEVLALQRDGDVRVFALHYVGY
jgi:hypothetical protein